MPLLLQPPHMPNVSFDRSLSFGRNLSFTRGHSGIRPSSVPTRPESWIRFRSHQTGYFRSLSTAYAEADPSASALDDAILEGKSRGKKREAKVSMWMNMAVVSGLCAGFAMQGLFSETKAPPDVSDYWLTVFHEWYAMIWCVSAFAYLFSTLGYVTLIMACTHIPNDFEFNYFARRAGRGVEAVPHLLFLAGFLTMYAGLVAWLLQVLSFIHSFCGGL